MGRGLKALLGGCVGFLVAGPVGAAAIGGFCAALPDGDDEPAPKREAPPRSKTTLSTDFSSGLPVSRIDIPMARERCFHCGSTEHISVMCPGKHWTGIKYGDGFLGDHILNKRIDAIRTAEHAHHLRMLEERRF